MKSVSPHVRQQSTWTYNQDEDDFNARVGKILNRGLDMKARASREWGAYSGRVERVSPLHDAISEHGSLGMSMCH